MTSLALQSKLYPPNPFPLRGFAPRPRPDLSPDSCFLAMAGNPRPKGRPRNAESPAKFATLAKWYVLVRSGAVLVKQAAAANGVDRRTMSRWLDEIEKSPEPEAVAARRLVGAEPDATDLTNSRRVAGRND